MLKERGNRLKTKDEGIISINRGSIAGRTKTSDKRLTPKAA